MALPSIGAGEGAAALDRGVDVVHRLLDDDVAGGLAGQLDRLQHRHAGGDRAGEGARPAGQRDLLDHVADFERAAAG